MYCSQTTYERKRINCSKVLQPVSIEDDIIAIVGSSYGVHSRTIKSRNGSASTCDCKRMITSLLRRYTSMTYKQIGSLLCLNYSSIINHHRLHDGFIETDSVYRGKYQAIQNEFDKKYKILHR